MITQFDTTAHLPGHAAELGRLEGEARLLAPVIQDSFARAGMATTRHAIQQPIHYRQESPMSASTHEPDTTEQVQQSPPLTGDAAVAVASLHAMGTGTLTDLEALYTWDAVNREAITEPPSTRGHGPAALYATALWLRTAFSDLAWQVHEVVHEGDVVVVHATMSGQQTGPFVAYLPDGQVEVAFPPRRRDFAVTQTHWFRMRDGLVAEHWANRDDLGMGKQLGWTPPTLTYLIGMFWATRRARRK